MDMRDEALPMHDYFIFVPSKREEKYPYNERPSSKSIWYPEESDALDLRLSWTRIALAEKLDIYARF